MTNPLFDLTGHVALVTGGNAGIGKGMAEGLAAAGASVALWGRRAEVNEQAAAEIARATGGTVVPFTVDVADAAAVEKAMAATVERFGRLDSVFANAGVGGAQMPFHEMPAEEFDRVRAVNVDGAVFTCQAAIKQFLAQQEGEKPEPGRGDGGSIVLTSSLAGIEGSAGKEQYGATKGAVLAIMRGLAVEYGRYGIRANAVLPGWIATDMTERGQGNPVFEEKVIKRVPIRRWGTKEDFAGAAVFLAGPASAFVTGQEIIIDGGYSIF